jgi:hypothetical protein
VTGHSGLVNDASDELLLLQQITASGDRRYEVRFGLSDEPHEIVATCEVQDGDIRTVATRPGIFDEPGHTWTGDAASVRAVFNAVIAFDEARRAGFVIER